MGSTCQTLVSIHGIQTGPIGFLPNDKLVVFSGVPVPVCISDLHLKEKTYMHTVRFMGIRVWAEDLCLRLSHSTIFYLLVRGYEDTWFSFISQVLYAPVRDFKGIPGSDKLHICLTGYQKNWRDDIMVCMVIGKQCCFDPFLMSHSETVHGQVILFIHSFTYYNFIWSRCHMLEAYFVVIFAIALIFLLIS